MPVSSPPVLWPLVVYFSLVVALAVAMLLFTYFLGERHQNTRRDTPYESGMLPTGSARIRIPVDFFLIAMFFVIFDLETVFIVAWAVSMRMTGWAGYLTAFIFIGDLLIALIYLWRVGALEWGSRRCRPARETER